MAHQMANLWRDNLLSHENNGEHTAPLNPARPKTPELVSQNNLRRRRLGSIEGRCALLHAIAHIEFNAINLAADMVARFAHSTRITDADRHAFISDWVGVCDDEARHFTMIANRLLELESHYGALPAHDGLWRAAISTKDDLAARLAIAPMVLEARGLDVTPNMIKNLENVRDFESADILKIIYQEEIAHVAAGTHWFFNICERENRKKETYFQDLVKQHFQSTLNPPFNEKARNMAGFPPSFYNP